MITLRIEAVTPERWDDVETLFGRNGAYANCWCTWWTWRASEWDRTTAAERKARLRAQIEGNEKPGLLAYDGDEPVGWCAIAPRQRYGRLTSPRARTYRPLDDRPSWVVTLVEGYPVEHDDGPAAMYTGTLEMFRREGFVVAARPGNRPLVRLDLPTRATSPDP